jgi:hypothetical protein
MVSKSYVTLEMHKPMNHTTDEGGCGCCGIHGGIPYGITYAPGDGAHTDTYPLGGTPHYGGRGGQCPGTG